MGEQRARSHAPRGQHFLAPRFATELVRNSGINRGDLVLDVGAGTGVLTSELADRAGHVIAVELDPKLARKLRRRFDADRRVTVVETDMQRLRLPREPFRVVSNVPFASTTEILRLLLDDPASALMRADLVVQWGAALKRCSQRPSTLQTVSWSPWYELTITRRLSRSAFRPPPSVDAAVITITRRPDELLPAGERDAFVRFLRRRFGSRPDATDLDAWEWVQFFRRACAR